MDNYKNHMRALIQLAMSDQSFDKQEKMMIYSLGKAHKIPEAEINSLVEENIARKGEVNVSFSALSFDDKFEFLYNIIQLMKVDNAVFLSEINYCEELAGKLGFDKRAVKKMSSRIYSDPSITSDRESLKNAIKKYEL